jgi:hypothetical protein
MWRWNCISSRISRFSELAARKPKARRAALTARVQRLGIQESSQQVEKGGGIHEKGKLSSARDA